MFLMLVNAASLPSCSLSVSFCLYVSFYLSPSLHWGLGSERRAEQASNHCPDSRVCCQKRMEHLPNRDAPPLYAGYWGNQGIIRNILKIRQRNKLDVCHKLIWLGYYSRKLQNAWRHAVLWYGPVQEIFLPCKTRLLLEFYCFQVIMIECADLKNVINYQEVEALKHTIKVQRLGWTEEWPEGYHQPPADWSSLAWKLFLLLISSL